MMFSLSLIDFCHGDEACLAIPTRSDVAFERNAKLNQDYRLLKKQLTQLPHLAGHLFLRLPLPQHQGIADCLLLYRGLIFILSLDQHSDIYKKDEIERIYQMATALKQHHAASKDKFIVPILIAPNAEPQGSAIHVSEKLVANTMCDTGENLAELIEHFANHYKDDEILAHQWYSETSFLPF